MIVDDHGGFRAVCRALLESEGFEVVGEAANGRDAVSVASRLLPAIVLLDVHLPGMDGFAVCRTIRRDGDLPIIMITARSETADVVRGLEAGADDYVAKPAVASELAARVRALLRRAHKHPGGRSEPAVLRAGDVEIHPDLGIATRAGEDVHLTRTELRLLSELAAADGKVVTREQLLERVWGYDYFGDTRLLDVHVRRLRRKVEDDPSEPRLVLTVRGVGYRAGT
jgi:two-component system response regulator MtrA